MSTTQQRKNYIEPSEFYNEMMACLKEDKISDRLSIMFQKLAEKYANHPKFVRYAHLREDLVSTAVLSCVKSFPKFRPYKDQDWDGETVRDYHYTYCNNPFAFFTTCIHNDFLHLLRNEYKQRNIVNKIRLEEGLEADYGYVDMIKDKEEAERMNSDDLNNDNSTTEDYYSKDDEPETTAGGIQW